MSKFRNVYAAVLLSSFVISQLKPRIWSRLLLPNPGIKPRKYSASTTAQK
ncbi:MULTISPECIES: hypothetical protein [unclassified Paenibacillus]